MFVALRWKSFLQHGKLPPNARGFSSQIPELSYNGHRPTLLVAESEPVEALSVRKLVLETDKFNVLTAHSFRGIAGSVSSIPQYFGGCDRDGPKDRR
jgi:hypothetical protein